MPPEKTIDEEDYASSEDSDFAPDEAPDDHASSADEDETTGTATATATTSSKRKRADGDNDGEAEDAGFENSGDEAVIVKGKKRRRKEGDKKGSNNKHKDDDDDDNNEGGTGGFVKTRHQRALEKAERRAAASVRGRVTIDVDALWAQMTSGKDEAAPSEPTESEQTKPGEETTEKKTATNTDMIKIKRTYKFAGKVHVEEKLVARDSAEAKLYAEGEKENENKEEEEENNENVRPPPRKAFRSAFEPVDHSRAALAGTVRTDLDLGLRARLRAREQQAAAARKLNTVEKSRMDWAGYVDKAGIQDELALAGRAKDSFAGRQAFLARSDALREEEARRARLASSNVK